MHLRSLSARALVAALAVAFVGSEAVVAAQSATHTARPAALVRVNQVGYATAEPKVAYLLAPTARPRAPFRIVDEHGATVLSRRAGASRGRWNSRYGAVQPLVFNALRVAGRYRIVVGGSSGVASPWFRVAPAAALLDPLIADTVTFFQAQRDGPDVIAGALHRKPSHLNDASATLYAWPTYQSGGSDVIVGDLTANGGSTDVAGGWFDAGDFIKFTHTTAYADSLLWAAQRRLGANAPSTLAPEARFGLDWLAQAWHPTTGVLDLQVGIGSGDQAGTYLGDHDLWRLPQKDDALPGSKARFIRHRPVFEANAPMTPLPPNLAGRVAAAFALAAQVDAAGQPVLAQDELDTAAAIFAAAKVSSVTQADVVTALPHAFYPESSWRDDMELAGAELTLAGQALGDARTTGWLTAGAHWASAYLAHEAGQDTLNLYDTSALAHADLVTAIRAAGAPGGLEVSQSALLADLRAQLGRGVSHASSDPFAAGAHAAEFDVAAHTFGLLATAQLYRDLTHDDQYADFASRQRAWVFGANAWGVSLMIGAGDRFPDCPQHVVANLSGHLDGTPPVLVGAVVNGPNGAGLFSHGLDDFFGNAPPCPANGKDRYARFSGHGSRFVDDVRAWQTVEPALDFSAIAAFALALAR